MTERAVPPVHDLLLALAGRVDDELLAWARELLAVGERDQAVELATAALAGESVALPPPLRAAFVAAGRAAQLDLDVDAALAPAVAADGTPHRFAPDAGVGAAVVATLTALPARRLAGCTVHLTWRRTPAGAAPGPLPHPVVLVATDDEPSADVLTYLLTAELARSGVHASVEVFAAGATLPAYHTAALAAARRVLGAAEVPRETTPAPDAVAPPPARHDRADTAPTPLFLVPTEPPAEPPRPPGRRRRAEPETAPDTDPLNGPLRVPLLAPLLDPTEAERAAAAPEPEPLQVPPEWEEDWRTGEWAMPPTPEPSRGPMFPQAEPDVPRETTPADDVSLFESPTARVDPGPRPGRRRRPDDDDAAELSGRDRDLLAQLQAELASRERRPRPYRRAGQNGSVRAVNGSDGDRPPPDMAG